ncbi:MAG: hypothetical protein HRU19_17350 [Pseudobacteriovorax sp.]|nr:hypothetical protein [Pseudobacteriovorax sp.]
MSSLKKCFVALTIFSVHSFAHAEEQKTEAPASFPKMTTECKLPDAYRKIWIEYGTSAGDNCEVHYQRDQNPAKVLWTAAKDPNYCIDKAKNLIENTLSSFTCAEVN